MLYNSIKVFVLWALQCVDVYNRYYKKVGIDLTILYYWLIDHSDVSKRVRTIRLKMITIPVFRGGNETTPTSHEILYLKYAFVLQKSLFVLNPSLGYTQKHPGGAR